MNQDITTLVNLLPSYRYGTILEHKGYRIPIVLLKTGPTFMVGVRRFFQAMADRNDESYHENHLLLIKNKKKIQQFRNVQFVDFEHAYFVMGPRKYDEEDPQSEIVQKWKDFEEAAYTALLPIIKNESQELDDEANVHEEMAKEAREKKRAFDAAFEATPEKGRFERKKKKARFSNPNPLPLPKEEQQEGARSDDDDEESSSQSEFGPKDR